MSEGQYPPGGQQPYGQQPYGAPYQPPSNYPPPPYSPPPPGFPPPAPARKRPVWPWIVGGIVLVILLSIGGCVAVFATVANDVTDEVNVVLEVTGTGDDVSITYSAGESGSAQIEDARLPWRKELTVDGVLKSVSLIATNGIESSGEITCKVTADGKVIAEQTSSGGFASASCFGFAS